jgi:hypothetical protein
MKEWVVKIDAKAYPNIGNRQLIIAQYLKLKPANKYITNKSTKMIQYDFPVDKFDAFTEALNEITEMINDELNN